MWKIFEEYIAEFPRNHFKPVSNHYFPFLFLLMVIHQVWTKLSALPDTADVINHESCWDRVNKLGRTRQIMRNHGKCPQKNVGKTVAYDLGTDKSKFEALFAYFRMEQDQVLISRSRLNVFDSQLTCLDWNVMKSEFWI